MQEYITAADFGRQQRPIAAAFAASGAGDRLLVQEAAQIGIDQTAFHLLDYLAQCGIGQVLACLSTRKVLAFENARHPDPLTIPDTGIVCHILYSAIHADAASTDALRRAPVMAWRRLSRIAHRLVFSVDVVHEHRHRLVCRQCHAYLDRNTQIGDGRSSSDGECRVCQRAARQRL